MARCSYKSWEIEWKKKRDTPRLRRFVVFIVSEGMDKDEKNSAVTKSLITI